jgi:hypothetical protein
MIMNAINAQTQMLLEQKSTIQCLDNKICNVRGEIPGAINEALMPIQTDMRAVKEGQKKQDEALKRNTDDIKKLFELVGVKQSVVVSDVPSPAPTASTKQSASQESGSRVYVNGDNGPAGGKWQQDQALQEKVRVAVESMARLLREAESKKNVVFLRRSNQAEEDFVLQDIDVNELVSQHASTGDFLIQNRGKAGYAITFYSCGSHRGEERAQQFVADVTRRTRNIWCVVERPQELRELYGRAHDFGCAFKEFCERHGRDAKSFYTFHAEFLIIGDQVIAPLPLLPAAKSWHDVFCVVCDVLELKAEKVNFRQPLQAQLWKPILTVICEAGERVELRDIEQWSSHPPKRSFVDSSQPLQKPAQPRKPTPTHEDAAEKRTRPPGTTAASPSNADGGFAGALALAESRSAARDGGKGAKRARTENARPSSPSSQSGEPLNSEAMEEDSTETITDDSSDENSTVGSVT